MDTTECVERTTEDKRGGRNRAVEFSRTSAAGTTRYVQRLAFVLVSLVLLFGGGGRCGFGVVSAQDTEDEGTVNGDYLQARDSERK